jgi:alkanesulfonate monooxygenase SsuD/methylene tetrahydromethanopterin reductase-like flavin-dependent oxidoreductase (luciferase family)
MDQGWAAPETSDAEAAAAVLAAIRLADELGFDSAWVGQHHHRRSEMAFWGRIPATEILLSHAAAQTRSIALGTGVRILSVTPAQRTAEEMRLLSLLSGGRVDFGVGLGSMQHGLKSHAEKAAEFRRLLSELLALLRDDPSTGVPELSPASPVDISTRLWAAARDETTLCCLADLGVNLVVGQAEMGSVQARYVQQYRASGGRGRTRGVRLLLVAPTRAEAHADSRAAAELYYSQMSKGGYHKEAVAKGLLPEVPASYEDMLHQVNFIAGTPDEVARDLNDYLAVTGVDQLDGMISIPRIRPDHVHRTMRLLQAEVRPQLVYRPVPAEPEAMAVH